MDAKKTRCNGMEGDKEHKQGSVLYGNSVLDSLLQALTIFVRLCVNEKRAKVCVGKINGSHPFSHFIKDDTAKAN